MTKFNTFYTKLNKFISNISKLQTALIQINQTALNKASTLIGSHRAKHLKRNLPAYVKYLICILLASCFVLQLCGFGANPNANTVSNDRNRNDKQVSQPQEKGSPQSLAHYQYQGEQLWDRIRKNFKIVKANVQTGNAKDHPKVQQFMKAFKGQEQKLIKASPYLYYIMEQLEKRNMPTELAFLPMIESAYEPKATSNKSAAGLWQFMPRTGKQFGLKQVDTYDGRRDIAASTNAALDYLSLLHKEFNQNWMLALAAYNAGEGRVRKAIQQNKKAGKPTTFWSLKLPKETANYVPQFLAWAELISEPKKHSVQLPEIENKPYFVPVATGKHMDLNAAAKMADLPLKEVKRLNPGHKGSIMSPTGPKELLLPVDNAQKFEENLSKEK